MISGTNRGRHLDHGDQDIEKTLGEWENHERSPERGSIGATKSSISSYSQGAPNDEIADIPDGGLRAWGVVLGALLAQYCSAGYVASFGVFQGKISYESAKYYLGARQNLKKSIDYYTRIYMTRYSAFEISWIGSVNIFLNLAAGLIAGRFYDRGYVVTLLYGGAFLMSLSLFMLSLAQPNQFYVVLLCQGIGVGIGGALIYVPSFAIVSQYFQKRRDMVLSLIVIGPPLGAMFNPIMINNLLQERNLGFGLVMRIHAGFTSVLLFVICLLVKPRVSPSKKHDSVIACFKRFAKDKAYVIMTAGFTVFGFGLFYPIFFLQLAAKTHGMSNGFAFYSLVILNGCSCMARIIAAVVAHKTRPVYMAIGSAFVGGVIIFAFLAIGSAVSIVLVAVIYGLALGILVTTLAPLTNELTDNPSELGLRLGNALAWPGLAELVGPPIVGALLKGYHWWRPTVFAGLSLLLASVCFVVVSIISRGRKVS